MSLLTDSLDKHLQAARREVESPTTTRLRESLAAAQAALAAAHEVHTRLSDVQAKQIDLLQERIARLVETGQRQELVQRFPRATGSRPRYDVKVELRESQYHGTYGPDDLEVHARLRINARDIYQLHSTTDAARHLAEHVAQSLASLLIDTLGKGPKRAQAVTSAPRAGQDMNPVTSAPQPMTALTTQPAVRPPLPNPMTDPSMGRVSGCLGT